MNQDLINIIGIKQNSRSDAILFSLNEVEGFVNTLDNDFNVWSDFDRWKNNSFQRWIFERAIEVYKGNKIDLRCTCCEYSYIMQSDIKNSLDRKCYGIKTVYMIEKILDEIIIAKARRENDGTYSA
tara:strand:- start:331 stop:708 length:378 start_codon:yes stop_codon:yes gene_type:complete